MMDKTKLHKILEAQGLQVVSIEDWVLIQRPSFDVHIGEEPYHSTQIYINLSTRRYVLRVWGRSLKSGELETVKDIAELCTACFSESSACVGWLVTPPEAERGQELLQVQMISHTHGR